MNRGIKILFGIIVLLIIIAGATVLWRAQTSKMEVYSKQTQPESKPKLDEQPVTKPGAITFLAMGDIMLSRNVAAGISKANKDPNWPFKNIATTLKSVDFSFANLESPFSGSDDFPASGSFTFNAPTWTLPGLVKNNFKVLNLANNHAFDQGKDGLLYTKNILDKANIVTIGTGSNSAEAWNGRIYEINGVKIGFIGASYSSKNDGGVSKNDYVARMQDTAKLKSAVAALKPKADYIVVTMHGGIEYTREPNPLQTSFAHAAIDDGADIVIGAHPHWIQTTETYKGKPIFYSLGNFIFDQMFSQDTKERLMLKISLQRDSKVTKLQQIQLMPVIIENYGQPRLANDNEKSSILQKIGVDKSIFNY